MPLLTERRRTGVTLDQRPLDANGIEEISGIFSSPRKPSPLKNVTILESVEESHASPETVEMSGVNSTCEMRVEWVVVLYQLDAPQHTGDSY